MYLCHPVLRSESILKIKQMELNCLVLRLHILFLKILTQGLYEVAILILPWVNVQIEKEETVKVHTCDRSVA